MFRGDKIDQKDVFQASIGAFGAIIFFFLLRDTPMKLDWRTGLGLTVAWLWVVYVGFNGHRNPSLRRHYFMCVIISTILSAALSLMFGLVTVEELTSIQIFGSTAMVGVLIGLPSALLFDLKNIGNVLAQYNTYIVKKKR